MRGGEPGSGPVLPRVRAGADRRRAGRRDPQDRDRAVRRRDRQHGARRAAGPGGPARPHGPLLRDHEAHDREPRRDGREVHRRRGHGRVRHPTRARGRRAARGPSRRPDPGRARGPQRRDDGEPRDRDPVPHGRVHGRSGRRRPGDRADPRHRRHGQHRRAARAGRAAGRDPDRSRDLDAGPGRRGRRGGRAGRRQGQGGAGAGVPARVGPARRRGSPPATRHPARRS